MLDISRSHFGSHYYTDFYIEISSDKLQASQYFRKIIIVTAECM